MKLTDLAAPRVSPNILFKLAPMFVYYELYHLSIDSSVFFVF